MKKKQFRLAELVKDLDVIIKGDPECLITGVCTIQQSHSGHITFLTNPLYRKYLANTKASAVIIEEKDEHACSTNSVITSNPHFVYSQVAGFFQEEVEIKTGIHPTAHVGLQCDIDQTASIGPHVVLGKHVKIGPHVVIGPGSVIGDYSEVGDHSYIDANVTIYHQVKMGKRVRLASGVVIGSDGFGFANQKGIWYKVPQLGGVVIGDDVDIGANTAIDRGAMEDTIIGNGVKLDNLIQVGHNVQIGENTIIAGCVAIAGSTIIGKNCMVGGGTCFAGHINICDHTIITGQSSVTKSIHEPGVYSSGIVGVVTNQEFRKNNARFYRLENLMQRVKNLELTLKQLEERTTT